jgi:class 3 adenylate cyclase
MRKIALKGRACGMVEQQSRIERRLAAILAADVAGFSRLMGLDEVGTAHSLREHRAVADALVAKHRGRIVKTTGDGILLEFSSVVDAVECALAVQAAMAERNEELPSDRRMLFRIGINLGDVLVDGDDILGDGVNVAARLESIANPAEFASRHPPTTRFAARSRPNSPISASRP